MKHKPAGLEGLILIELTLNIDERGFFTERYKRSAAEALGLPREFAQDNHSRSMPGVLRGLHYQSSPPQGKLVGVTRGRVWDVAVDIRADSTTYGHSYGVELSDLNGLLLWVPPGFAHGFCVLGDEPADVLYKVDAEYNPASESGIHWSDPDLSIEWPLNSPQLSARDMELKSFAQYNSSPIQWS